jgi:hypothetical protein
MKICELNTLRNLGLLSWGSLIVGKENGWISKREIIECCDYILDAGLDQNSIDVIILADSSDNDFMAAVYKKAGQFERPIELDKWRLAFLLCIFNSPEGSVDKINKLQLVYSDFDYPEEMEGCSIYSEIIVDPLVSMKGVILSIARRLGVKNIEQGAMQK